MIPHYRSEGTLGKESRLQTRTFCTTDRYCQKCTSPRIGLALGISARKNMSRNGDGH